MLYYLLESIYVYLLNCLELRLNFLVHLSLKIDLIQVDVDVSKVRPSRI